MDYVSTEELEKIGIKVEEDGIYIVKAERVDSYDASSIEQKLLQLGVLEAPYSDIIDLFKKHLKNPTKVADSFVEYEAGKNEFIRVTVSKDALEAYLDVTFPSTDIEKISDRDILHKIYEAEITYNIDREKLNQIVRNRIFVGDVSRCGQNRAKKPNRKTIFSGCPQPCSRILKRIQK